MQLSECLQCFRFYLLITFLVFSPLKVNADAIGTELLLLTMHLGNETIQLGDIYQRRLSSDGRYVITPGIELNYDNALRSAPLGLDNARFAVAWYKDSVDHHSGYVAYLLRWDINAFAKTNISIGLGPTLIFRESWNKLPHYNDDGYYSESNNFLKGYQHKWIIGGDVDFQWQIGDQLQAVFSIVPGIPFVITCSMGIRWNIN